MSLARQFFREFRPLVRLLEEPLGSSPAFYGSRGRSLFDDPFFQSAGALRPAVDVTEEGNNYIVEADLPGVKKENVEVRIGDGGHSVTIEGKIIRKQQESPVVEGQQSEAANVNATASPAEGSNAVTTTEQPSNQISSERSFTGSSIFTRTVWLPRPVDGEKVAAKLTDGVLTVTIPKAEDRASVRVPVE